MNISAKFKKIRVDLGLNRIVIALSFARMADAIGSSLLFVIVAIYMPGKKGETNE